MAELLAYVCSHVFRNTHPVLLVCRADGDWQFLCGGRHVKGELPELVGMNHLIDRDPSLNELMDLPADWEAERLEIGSPWQRVRVTPFE